MKAKEILDLSIKIGMEKDFRTKEEIKEMLKGKKEKYEALPKEEKPYFDKDELKNPYMDSAIHYDNGKDVKKALVGIDITMGGLHIAKQQGFDLVINHHPIGKALTRLDDVMDYQVDTLEKFGVPVNIAEKLMQKRISEVARGINPANHYAVVDAARLLDMNLINIHTPADNCVASFVTKQIEKAKPKRVKDVLRVLNEIPEYQEAKRRSNGPALFTGSEGNRCGKTVVSEMTGGTEGAKDIFQAMASAGIGTIVGMHQSEEHRKNAEAAHMNVIIAGHISSDSIGMNVILDELEKRGLEITPFAGLIRKKRNS
ncbi:MAG: NGG1p interacting factor NIF3 [Candidatus Moranbacteria bacterium]|nr:NGG1p interacting factor NIF3 [Candidatus Moranbacteria bacterium]